MRGLARFRTAFERHANQYVLIGGTAATLAMESAGLSFRATKDLDVVLHIEALDAAFGATFWRFIEAGAYEVRQRSTTGKQIYYRFQKPGDDSYPAMLELFSRAPAGIALGPDARITAATKIVADLHRFLDAVGTAGVIDPHALGLGSTLTELIDRIGAAYR